ncbi:hypothetical protein [Ciceribacter sp. L1K23]|uniref:hypothetical protein n=1 Tax=Ciceribacter sp. L1K23 TaxID=2820276 RepID=UPI002010F265|nr:hypothetical protein [Ciceribacter sp. L1K23]
MFKICKSSVDEAFDASHNATDESGLDLINRFSMAEGWVGDLANGVIRLGEYAKALHGVDGPECGLLSMMRCYETQDRAHILGLFEQAATTSSSFCYSTTIHHGDGRRQPVFCIGESAGLEEQAEVGTMAGVFLFPKFKISAAALARLA